jgi:hypothetical protein
MHDLDVVAKTVKWEFEIKSIYWNDLKEYKTTTSSTWFWQHVGSNAHQGLYTISELIL